MSHTAIMELLPSGAPHPYTELLEALPRVDDRALVETVELPAIAAAWRHATANESRELTELDNAISRNPDFAAEATASAELGANFFKSLLPLRDERVLKRHAAAVEQGDAPGSHLVVFGLMLTVFSIPPRQALLDYTQARLPETAGVPAIISDLLDRAA
jgi:urease accessory protein UreF